MPGIKRPLCQYAVSLSFGMLLASVFGFNLVLLAPILVVGVFLFAFRDDLEKNNHFTILVLVYILGAAAFLYQSHAAFQGFDGLYGKNIEIHGAIDSNVENADGKDKFVVASSKGKILVTLYDDGSVFEGQYGSKVSINAVMEMPKQRTNPGGFNYREYLIGQGISGLMTAELFDVTVEEREGGNPLKRFGLYLRSSIINTVKSSMPQAEAGLLNGMLIGDTTGLEKDLKQSFRDSGLSHIMAVSGANVAFILFPFMFLFKKLKIRRDVANIILIFIVVLFVLVTGFQASVCRAAIMAITLLWGRVLIRETDALTCIAFSAILMLVANPHTLLDVGFQFSYLATISLVLLFENIEKIIKRIPIPSIISVTVGATLAAQIGVLPLQMLYFNSISMLSLFSNIIVVPITEVVTVLGFAMLAFPPVKYLNYWLLRFILFVSETISNIPLAVLRVATPSVLFLVVFYVAVFFALWYFPKKGWTALKRYFVLGLAAILLIISVSFFIPKNLEVVFIDVGQGDSELIKTASGKAVLIDGGGEMYSPGIDSTKDDSSSVGENILVPFLLDYGVTRLDAVVATHPHDDHIKGLFTVLENIRVDKLVVPDVSDKSAFDKLLNAARKHGTEIVFTGAGDQITVDKYTQFDILYPQKGQETTVKDLNNDSLVIKLTFKNNSILFTGDADKEAEGLLVAGREDLKADVLKVAHHGSAESAHNDFLERVDPTAAIIEVGKNNFGHPSMATLDRLRGKGITTYRTDLSGAVILKSDGDSIKMYSMIP